MSDINERAIRLTSLQAAADARQMATKDRSRLDTERRRHANHDVELLCEQFYRWVTGPALGRAAMDISSGRFRGWILAERKNPDAGDYYPSSSSNLLVTEKGDVRYLLITGRSDRPDYKLHTYRGEFSAELVKDGIARHVAASRVSWRD